MVHFSNNLLCIIRQNSANPYWYTAMKIHAWKYTPEPTLSVFKCTVVQHNVSEIELLSPAFKHPNKFSEHDWPPFSKHRFLLQLRSMQPRVLSCTNDFLKKYAIRSLKINLTLYRKCYRKIELYFHTIFLMPKTEIEFALPVKLWIIWVGVRTSNIPCAALLHCEMDINSAIECGVNVFVYDEKEILTKISDGQVAASELLSPYKRHNCACSKASYVPNQH